MAAIMQLPDIEHWRLGLAQPLLIGGPCGVESPTQINAIARALAGSGVGMLRGGIWKPRTRPGSFQGIGSEALTWLKDAGVSVGMPVMVEVASPFHVGEALTAGIDVLWIGARTTVNPFLVQEICEALRGVDIPVMVKNPVHPDLELWIGALERLDQAGIHRLAAIHRGFHTYEKSRYRNAPLWSLPLELKRRIPTLPILNDPSHICGDRALIAGVAQTAIDLGFNGLMVEVHPDPANALSDPEQQLTPDGFRTLIAGLVFRKPTTDDAVVRHVLDDLRKRIDRIDDELLELLAVRMQAVREIGEYKREHNMTIFQLERWNEILRTRPATGAGLDLNKQFVVRLMELIHEDSIHQQSQILYRHPTSDGKDAAPTS